MTTVVFLNPGGLQTLIGQVSSFLSDWGLLDTFFLPQTCGIQQLDTDISEKQELDTDILWSNFSCDV